MKQETFSEPPEGDQAQGWAIIAACWSLVTVAFISTATRLWIRSQVTRNLGWDDLFITIAMVGEKCSARTAPTDLKGRL